METKYNILNSMKGMRRYGWMRPTIVNVPSMIDGAMKIKGSEPVSEKGKAEMARWIKIEEICHG